MPFRSAAAFRPLVVAILVVVVTAFSALPVAALDARWPKQERFARILLNCTRTGGWVQDDGTCIDRGTGKHSAYREPLSVKTVLADDIARPQARRVAKAGYLSHTLGGSITTRFARAGIHCCAMGESIGHWRSSVKEAVIQITLMVQAEKETNGWHWRNVKDTRFDVVGIGIWNKGSDVYVAFDFWDGQ